MMILFHVLICQGGTESAIRGCKPASTDDTGTDVALFPRWTAPTAKAASTTATHATRWTDVVCFSCGKSGHPVTRCPNLNEAFPFLQPGWRTEKTPGGFVMIPPRGQRTAGGRKTTADPGGRVRLSGQYSRSAPGPSRGNSIDCSPTTEILDDVSLAAEQSGGTSVGFSWMLVRQYGRKRLWLRTLVDGSVFMMLDYTRIRALCGCQMMVCL